MNSIWKSENNIKINQKNKYQQKVKEQSLNKLFNNYKKILLKI